MEIIIDRLIRIKAPIKRPNHHAAAVFTKSNIYSVGINEYDNKPYPGCSYDAHAEMVAFLKIPPPKNTRKFRKVNLIVIRVDKHGKLKYSKPCMKCIEFIGYHSYNMMCLIDNIYYSTEDGTIIRRKFMDLYLEKDGHMSKRFTNKN